jgi:hypothetical protein
MKPILLALAVLAATPAFAATRVDIGQDNGRRDVLSKEAENWQLKETQADTRKFGDITATLRAPSGTLAGALFKGGLDTGAVLATDGVTVNGGNTIELTLTGLAAGKHTLVTVHNALNAQPAQPLAVSGGGKSVNVTPSHRVESDYDAATAFVEFTAEAGKPVTFTIKSSGNEVILNGFALDVPDPQRQALKPSPAHNDEHAEETPTLTWAASKSATTHNLYLGTDKSAVENASPNSPEFKGALTTNKYEAKDLDPWLTYYWRVDEVGSDKTVTRGETWRFRTRQLAFPGAEGYGRFARGGRGGRVIEVTNLEDYAAGEAPIPGSYRAAIEAEGPRIIVFRVSGLIQLKRDCPIRNGYVTVAGQTAPGDGICLANYSAGMATNDAIVRYIRVRIGDKAQKAMDGMGLGSSDNCIIDHCSISWAMDEGTSSRGGHNITFQWNIISEMLQHGYHYNAKDRSKYETHAFAGSISGDIGSYHHNLLAHCTDRNWSLAGGLNQAGQYAGRLDIRNNVVYNWTARTTDGGVKELNYVNNYYKPYPQQKSVNWLLKLDPLNPAWGTEKYYMVGNVMEGFDYEKDNWKAFFNGKDVERQVRVDQPLYPSYVKEESARDAYQRVLADVGANLPRRDVIDRRIIEEVRTGTVHYTGKKAAEWAKDPGHKNNPNFPGIIDTQDDVHDADDSPVKPWPHYKTYDVPADADHDGIPDAWETAHGLNPKDPTDSMKKAANGYANIENYFNSLTPQK